MPQPAVVPRHARPLDPSKADPASLTLCLHPQAELATVVMIRANKDGKSEKAKEDAAEAPLADTAGPVTSSKGNSSDAKAQQQQQQQQQESSSKLPSLDKSVDRIIDSRDNEFVLSYSK
jgi:hypothetical protein